MKTFQRSWKWMIAGVIAASVAGGDSFASQDDDSQLLRMVEFGKVANCFLTVHRRQDLEDVYTLLVNRKRRLKVYSNYWGKHQLAQEIRKAIDEGSCHVYTASDFQYIKNAFKVFSEKNPDCYLEELEPPHVLSIPSPFRYLHVDGKFVRNFLKGAEDLLLAKRLKAYPSCQGLPSFELGALDRSFSVVSESLYSQKRGLLLSAGNLAKDIPVPNEEVTPENLNHLMGRLFVLNVVAPVILGTDSARFASNIHPLYQKTLNRLNAEYGIKSLKDFQPTSTVLKASLSLLSSAFRESKAFVSDEGERVAIESLLSTIGTTLSEALTRSSVEPVVAAMEKNQSLLSSITSNRHTRELGQVAQSISEYLVGI